MKISFTTNFCPHYRTQTFSILARYYPVDFYFFSAGDEWYWLQQHGVQKGNFSYTYLPGVRIAQTRITPTLPWKLWENGYDIYVKCINGRFALPITYIIARLRRKPFILWTGIWTRIQTRAHRWFFPLTRYIYQHADAIVVYGEHVKRYLISEGVPAERIFIAAHAVDNPAYNRSVPESELSQLRQQLEIGNQQKVVLYLGRLEDGKGLDYLINAFSTVAEQDDTILVLAGTGSQEKDLRQLVQEKGIADKVRFTGYIPSNQTVTYYALAWVYILPSVTTATFKEPWGLVVNEAMNQGTPVIATDAVGAAAGGLVQDGVNGFVVPERNSCALAQAIHKMLNNTALRDHMSQNARQTMVGWDNEQMIAGFRQAITYVTSRPT
jgi:glycosyltransferase involved in cell wall biosynthesis